MTIEFENTEPDSEDLRGLLRYLRIEEGEHIPVTQLRYIGKATIQMDSYWLWKYQGSGKSCFAFVRRTEGVRWGHIGSRNNPDQLGPSEWLLIHHARTRGEGRN